MVIMSCSFTSTPPLHPISILFPYTTLFRSFVGVRTIHVGRVEECDAQIQRPVNRPDRFLIIAARVKLGHAHAPEDRESVVSGGRGDDEDDREHITMGEDDQRST